MAKRKTYEFLQLTSVFPYPPTLKGELATIHSTFIDQALEMFDGTKTCKTKLMHIFNCITYMYTSGDALAPAWNPSDPIHTFLDVSDEVLEESLHDKYISLKDIDWVDMPINKAAVEVNSSTQVDKSTADKSITKNKPGAKKVPISDPVYDINMSSPVLQGQLTDKSDLYIQPPTVPRFDASKAYAAGTIDGTPFVIYTSYPEIPTKQNEISVTTDVNKMTDKDLLKLFPTSFIRTRAECMYQLCEKIELHPQLGLILPIQGYSRSQLIDNIIKYPHLFKLQKDVDGQLESFYSTIEINGELHKISDIWKDLPESSIIPYTKEFIKEYVARRYLLERDIKHVEHRYKLYGTLDPFLTLFTTISDYAEMGYDDAVELATSCVTSRISYKKSRNPVLRRLTEHV